MFECPLKVLNHLRPEKWVIKRDVGQGQITCAKLSKAKYLNKEKSKFVHTGNIMFRKISHRIHVTHHSWGMGMPKRS